MMTRRVMAVAVLTMALAAMPAAAGEPGQHPGSGMPAMTGGTLDALGPVIGLDKGQEPGCTSGDAADRNKRSHLRCAILGY